MKLIIHIVKKDLRRFWPGIVILAAIVTLKFLLADTVFHVDPPGSWPGRLQRYQAYLLIAEVLLSFALAVGVVLEDSVPDAGALCQTLPITRGQLLGAKLLCIVSVCVLPVLLVLSVGWVVLGLPAGQIGWPLLVFAEAQLGLGLAALAFGSLAKNAGHLLFWLLGVILALAIPAMIVEPMLHSLSPVTPGTQLTHTVLVHCAWVAASLAVIFNQYLGRSRKRSIAFLGTGVLLSFYFTETERTPLSLDFATNYFPAQRELDAQISHLGVSIGQADFTRPNPEADDPLADILLRMSVEEPSRGLLIAPRGLYCKWRWSVVMLPTSLHLPRDNDLKRVAERELGFRTDPAANRVKFGAETHVSPSILIGGLGAQPLQGQIDLGVYHTSVDGELPLTKGASLHSAAGTATILGVKFDGSIISVEIEGEFSGMRVDPGWLPGLDALGSPISRRSFALVNRKTKTVLTSSRPYSTMLNSYAYGVDLGHVRLAYPLPKAETGAESLTDWRLVEVSMGDGHRSILGFQANFSLQEVPAITRDPAWQM